MSYRSWVLLAVGLLLAEGSAAASAPDLIPLQGVLSDATGLPLDGDIRIDFSIYDSESGGILLWTETQWVPVTQGLFSTYLGTATPIDLTLFRDHSELWLGIKVEDDPEMPRVLVGSVPYAAYAEYTGQASLSLLTCAAGQVAKFNGSEWACADDVDTDTDTQLSESQVDDYVANNGYLVECGIDYTDCQETVMGTDCHGVLDVEHCCAEGYVVVGVDNASVNRSACCRLRCQ